MKALILLPLCLLLAACSPPRGYLPDYAVNSYRAHAECVRMEDSRISCPGDLIAAEPRDMRLLWND